MNKPVQSHKADIAFWNNVFEKFKPYEVNTDLTRQDYLFIRPIVTQLKDKNILEIGCDKGDLSVFLAKHGGNVLAIDNTQNGVRDTLELATFNSVKIRAEVMDALDVNELGERFDYVVGKFVLHHIEPFNEFSARVKKCMKPGALGIFYENSSRNRILIFFRNNLVGKFGVPKYGDAVEVPLEDAEIEMLRENFAEVKITIPRFVFFSMLGGYIFRKSKNLQKFFNWLDKVFYERVKIFNKNSYHQIVTFKK